MTEQRPPRSKLRQVRLLLWALVFLALVGSAALIFWPRTAGSFSRASASAPGRFGAFTLVGADGKPFSSEKLKGRPYAIYFGFTRCGDVCPTTLSRLVKLREQSGGKDGWQIVFVTIDPTHDGPKDVGQYAELFNSPIIGLTGTPAQIDAVKKQYAIFAQPMPHAAAGHEMEHTSTVLLFDSQGQLAGTISPDESDADALASLKALG